VLLFASALPSEGKSTTVTALAALMAHTGKRVLLIDADLRASMLHQAFESNCIRGVTDCLDATCDLDAAIQVDSRTGVSLLAAGPYDPRSQNILRSPRLYEAIEAWRRSFDYILIDTPPVLPISDARILVPMVDRCVLVVRWGKTRWASVTHALRQLAEAGAEIAGVIVSQVDVTQLSRYDFADSDAYGISYRRYTMHTSRLRRIAAQTSRDPAAPLQ
jgi:capsular exopolysaccharide synthesis family protein